MFPRGMIFRMVFGIALLVLHKPVSGQVIAGMRVNGKVVKRGDTINVCTGSFVYYQSIAQNASTVTWKFKNGNPNSYSGALPPAIFYNTVGVDSTVQWAAGGNESDSTHIFIRVSDTRPVANFTFSPNNACANIPVQFTNLSTGSGLSYSWNFGDNNTSTEKDPAYPFLNAIGTGGTQAYQVSLITTNALGCSAFSVQTVTVKRIPDASIGVNDPTVDVGTQFNGLSTIKRCSNLPFYTFDFINRSTTTSINTSYTIQWGDNSPDTTFTNWPAGTVIPHEYPLGNSIMTVKVTGSDGCIGIKKYNIFLGSTPSGGLTSLGNEDICSDDSLRFAITSVPGNPNPPGTQYNFIVNDGSAAQVFQQPPPAEVSHYFRNGSCGYFSNYGIATYLNAFGAYLTIQNPCGTKSFAVVPIYVSGKPRASFNVSPSKTVCVNTNVTIQSTATYGAVVTSSNPLCTNNGKLVWAISPSAGYTITTGNTGSFNGNPANGNAWTGGTPLLNVNFTATGTYTVKQYVYNNRCGMDSTVQVICVRNPPQASFTMSKNSSCGPGSAVFTNTSPAGGCQGDNYEWQVTYTDPLGCSSGQNPAFAFINGTDINSVSPEIQFNVPGRYIIRLTVTAKDAGLGCSPAIKEDSFFVAGPPKVSINAINTICPDNDITPAANVSACYSPGPLEYQWTFTNGSPAASGNPDPGTVHYTALGTFPVQLTVTDRTCNTSTTATTNVSVIPRPVADAGNDKAICSGDSVQLGITGISGVTYQWSPVTGLSDPAVANPLVSLLYAGPGSDTTYGYKLVASTGADCFTEDSVYITVKRKPVIIVNPLNPQLCIGDSIKLVAGGADSYSWIPAASLDNSNSDTVYARPAVTTIYSLTGILQNGCSDTTAVPVIVHPDAKAEFTANSTVACTGVLLDTLIRVVPFPEGNNVYTWYANGLQIGSNNNGNFPSYPVNGAGRTVVIKLVTQSPFGCKPDSMEMTFNTIPGVTPQFTKNTAGGCGPLKVYFRNTSSLLNNILFSWDFGNGTTGTVTQPDSVTFNSSLFNRDTTYYITLKAFNGCDTILYKDSVKVFANARAAFNVSSVTGCSPFRAVITNLSSGNNFVYYWDFGDGSTDTTYTTGNFTHTYYTGFIDTFTIHLTAVNQCGRHSDSIDVVVSPATIQPLLTINGSSLTGCAPHTATFINNPSGAALLIVQYNDGSKPDTIAGSQKQFNHRFNNPGTYAVSIQMLNDCTDTTIIRPVTVFTPPDPSFSLSQVLVCTGATIQTNNTSQHSNAYVWDWGDSTTSTGFNASHTYTKAGIYEVHLLATLLNNFGTVCTISAMPVTVTVVDLVPANIDTGNMKPCVPYNLTVTAAGAQNARTIEWVFYDSSRTPAVFRATGITASYQYNNPGQYNVKLIVENAAGCRDSIVHHFRVYDVPGVELLPFNVTTCTTDTIIDLTITPVYSGFDALIYKWLINDELKAAGNPFSFRFQVPGNSTTSSTFSVKALVENTAGCGDTVQAGNLTIRPLLKPGIAVTPGSVLQQPDYTFTFTDTVITAIGRNYSWDFGDGRPPGNEKEVTHKYGDTGMYKVTLQVNDAITGCIETDTAKVFIEYVPGYLYVPNAICPGCSKPGLRYFLPQGTGLKDYRLRIFNALGQLIFETTGLDANGSPNEPWDGKWNGKILQQDSYGWQIEARYINETEWKGMLYPGSNRYRKAGFITVIK